MHTPITMMMNFFCFVSNIFTGSPEEEVATMDLAVEAVGGEDQGEAAYPTEGYACLEYTYCLAPHRVYLGHTEGRGLGYRSGYTSFGAFFGLGEIPDVYCSKVEPFADVRAHVLNDGHFGLNIGFGARYINYFEYIWGANLYYDWRSGEFGHYNQIGLGLEILAKHWSIRANFYCPLGAAIRSSRPAVFYGYADDYVVFGWQVEKPRKGVDAELGYSKKIYCDDFKIYAGIGEYFFERSPKNVVGGMFRVMVEAWGRLALEGRVYYDRVHRGLVQGALTLAFPFAKRSRVQRLPINDACGCTEDDVWRLKSNALQPVLRNEIIYVESTGQYRVGQGPVTQSGD